MVFEPQKEAFFELATKRLPDRGNRTHLKAGIHPEIERPAILNRSMPSTACATIGIRASPFAVVFRIQREIPSRDKERH
jgi:hypothetical protein